MLVTRLHVGLACLFPLGMAGGFVWKHVENSNLRTQADTQAEGLIELQKRVAQASQRASMGETRVAELLKASEDHKRVQIAKASAPQRAAITVKASEIAQAATARAKELIAQGKAQEALEVYLTAYREVQPVNPGSSECQRLMGAIKHLGRNYPPALAALGSLRDSAEAQYRAKPEQHALAFEVALLDKALDEGQRTLALYDELPPGHTSRGSLAMVGYDAFIRARRYHDALVGRSYGQMLGQLEAGLKNYPQAPEPLQAPMRKAIIEQTLTSIEVLTGAGKAHEARALTDKLLAFDNQESTRAALQQHLERALRR